MENIRPIRTEADYEWALAEIEPYFLREPAAGTAEADRFDVLFGLVEAYESRHWPIMPPDPVDAIRFKMDIAGLTQSDLAKVVGSRSRASEILARRRTLSMALAAKLHDEWRIPAEILIRPYPLASRKQPRPKQKAKSRIATSRGRRSAV